MKEYWQMLRVISIAILILASSLSGARADGGRVALVVGVSKYEHAASLTNTLNDAKDITAALKRLGFEVETVFDPNRSALEAAVRRYGDRSAGAEASVFYYSGHALEAGGRNWLVPATANLNTERDLRFETVDLNTILEQTDGAAKVAIVFLDACRDNPFARRLSATQRGVASRGLARVDATTGGMLVAFSTAPGQVALDGARKNSPFTAALLSHIETVGLEIKSLLARVTKDVVAETKGKQRPWQNSSLEGDFYFLPPPASAAAPSAPAAPSAANLEGLFWDSIKGSRNPADFKAYLAKFPSGVFAELARNRLAVLEQETASRPPAASAAQAVPSSTAVQAAPPPQSPAPVPLTTRDMLLARMAAYAVVESERESQAQSYGSDEGHKAIALSVEGHRTYRTNRWATAGEAEIGALEGCQLAFGKPCAVIAVDDKVQPEGPPIVRDMPRAHYAGPFDLQQIPRARPELLRRGDITNYRSASEPKAAAFHHLGALFVVIGGGGQFEAEELALNQCNNDPVTKGRGGPCLLYAVGNQVVLPQRSVNPLRPRRTDSPAPQQAAIPPQTTNSSLRDRLIARLTALSVAAGSAENIARNYEVDKDHKAIAVAVKAHGTWRHGQWATDEAVVTATLERCQLFYGEPCVLAAVGDKIEPATSGPPVLRDMPRTRYDGGFEPEQIAGANGDLKRRADVTSYRSASGPKAAAYHPSGRMFIVAGATGQFEAEELALSQCNNDPDRNGKDGPCFVYAVGDQVVLPQRSVKPVSQRRSDPPQSQQVPVGLQSSSASTSLRDGLRVRLAALAVASDEAEARIRDYETDAGHKAIAVAVKARLIWKATGRPSEEAAVAAALESCQVHHQESCTLVASDDKVAPSPNGPPVVRDMPHTRYTGRFEPERVPSTDGSLWRRADVASYRSTSGPKAAAYHPWGRLFIVAGGAGQFEAEEQALAQCDNDPGRKGADGPCFLYAVGDHVVLPQRLEKPRPRPQTISEAFDYLGVPRHSYGYGSQNAHKAIAFAPESGQTFRWGSQSSAAIAEQKALEGCQLSYRTACVILASGDELRAPDPWKAARRDMPRLHHEGKYRPESVPLFSGTENELQSYVSLRAPKAMVIRPSRGRVRTAAGTTAEEAQSKALAACNDDADPLPCFVYAVNDTVIIGQRRTEPQK